MTLEINGVPSEISRKTVLKALESWGFDPQLVTSLRIDARSVLAEVYAPDQAVKHSVFIQVVD